MSGTWSQRVEQCYALQLPEDVRAWLDQQMWQEPGGAEFCRALAPEQLLDPEPGTIWAGFMMPDTLPIIGNDYGDWLCLRIAADGTVSELLHWSHCGGDYIPYGRTLAEGLLYDAAVRVLHPLPSHMAGSELPADQVFRSAQWARQWLAADAEPMQPFWNSTATRETHNSTPILEMLGKRGVAEFAVSRDRILQHLESPFKVTSEPALARQIGVSWEPDFVRWMFDNQLIPESTRCELQQTLNGTDGQLFTQNWQAAEREATAVIQRRQDLGWAFDVAGWAAQRRGDWPTAIQHYLAGMQTRWRVHEHWLALARTAEQQGENRQAYQHYYRAGWDLGLQPLDGYDEIFAGLARSALADGAPALAAIAEMHQRFLVSNS